MKGGRPSNYLTKEEAQARSKKQGLLRSRLLG